jgi:hypothetical protein
MSQRFLLLLLLLVHAGCAANSEGIDPNHDLGASSDMGFPNFDLGECAVVRVSPSNAVAPTTLTAVAQVQATSEPSWTVTGPSGGITPAFLDTSGLSVQVEADEPGTYTFRVQFASGYPCPGTSSAFVVAPSAQGKVYRLRLTPPGSAGLPQQDRLVTVYGGSPKTDQDLFLEQGTLWGGVLRNGTAAIAGEVHLLPVGAPELKVAVGASGSFSLPVRVDLTYRVLLVPKDPALAPRLLGPLAGADLFNASTTVGAGQPVSGVIRDELGTALSGAHVALRAGPLPSGLGDSALDGSFALRAEPGSYQLAAAADGWPDLLLDGVSVPQGGVTLGLDHALTRASVAFRVLGTDGVTPVAGARVRVRSLPVPGAATVTWPGGSAQATAVARLLRQSGSDGTLGAAQLPSGTYDVLIEPSDAGMPTTGLRKIVSGSGPIDLVLAARVALSGVVRDENGLPVGSARVRLIGLAGTVLRETLTAGDGGYTILLDAGVPAELHVEPPVSAMLAAARVHLGSSDGALGQALPATTDVTLGAGLPIAGTVRGPNAAPLPGVAVDVLCLSCGDSTPLSHGESDATGAYRVAVPDPGFIALDAGSTD